MNSIRCLKQGNRARGFGEERLAPWRLLAIVLLCMSDTACSDEAKEVGNGSNTSWLQHCADPSDCGAAGICVNGVCTTECSVASDCHPLAADSTCAVGVRPALSRDDTCDDVRTLDVCVPGCEVSQDCSHLGPGFECDGTRCLPEPCTTVQGPLGSANGGAGGAPVGGGGQVAGAGGRGVGTNSGAAGTTSEESRGGDGGQAAGASGRGAVIRGGEAGIASGNLGGALAGGMPIAGRAGGGTRGGAGGAATGTGGSAGTAGVGSDLTESIVGSWHEEARFDCATGAELPAEPAPIGEIVFTDVGTFSVTWTPFEWYEDYEGAYVVDSEAGTIEMTVMGSNYLPADTDLAGSYYIDGEGKLVLEDIWFGTDANATATPACGHRLARD